MNTQDMNARNHHATIEPARYDMDARADAVSRGLAVRTLGVLGSALLVSIEGARSDAERWTMDHGGTLAKPLLRMTR